MTTKQRKDPKRDLLLGERGALLGDIDRIDALLANNTFAGDAGQLKEYVFSKYSFRATVDWLQPLIQQSLVGIEAKLDNLAKAMEQEFPWPIATRRIAKQDQDRVFLRFKAIAMVKMFLDSSLILYALGRNGPAIIDLHGILEREAIERVRVIRLPDGLIAKRPLDRADLIDLAPMLQTAGIIGKGEARFAQTLGKLRNSLAHRNLVGIANAFASGQDIRETEVDAVLEDVDFVSLVIGAIHFLAKVIDWGEEEVSIGTETELA